MSNEMLNTSISLETKTQKEDRIFQKWFKSTEIEMTLSH